MSREKKSYIPKTTHNIEDQYCQKSKINTEITQFFKLNEY